MLALIQIRRSQQLLKTLSTGSFSHKDICRKMYSKWNFMENTFWKNKIKREENQIAHWLVILNFNWISDSLIIDKKCIVARLFAGKEMIYFMRLKKIPILDPIITSLYLIVRILRCWKWVCIATERIYQTVLNCWHWTVDFRARWVDVAH